MKLLSWITVGVVIASGADVAAADSLGYRDNRPASAYEVGFVWQRFDVDALSQPVTAKIIRFDTRAWFTHHLYFGGEADFGQLSADTDAPLDVLARSESSSAQTGAVGGTLGAAKVVLGAGTNAGAFSGGAELATGVRYAAFDRNNVAQAGGMLDTAFVLEGRARLDLQLTRVLTVGAVAGVDLQDHRAVMAGLVVGMRFARDPSPWRAAR